MISNEERREVAAKIEALPDNMYTRALELLNDGTLDLRAQDTADYYEIYYALFGVYPTENQHPNDYEELHQRLADLIDPMCHDTESKDSPSFTCSGCGFSKSELTINPFTLSFLECKPSYRYCPNCGARVVRDDA